MSHGTPPMGADPPEQTPSPLGADTIPPGSRHTPPQEQTPPDGHCTGSTHPTGMHSCINRMIKGPFTPEIYELLHELFSPQNHEKWVHNPLLNFSVHAKVDQMASVNAPT